MASGSGDASIGIVVDPRGAVSGARTVRRSLDDISGGARSAFSAVQMLTGALASIGVGLGLRDAIRTIGSFQEALSGVQAVTRATGNEMKVMEREARRLGATTRYTAGQAAEGMRFLGMAGFETSAIIKAMPAVLNLATAAAMDLGRAADITSNIMSAFGVSADETGRIADALAMAASSANTSVEQLGDAMSYVGPVAAAFNVSMEDAAAATATLSNAGIQGSMAGTGLRRVFSSLTNPTKEAQRSIESLGLTMAEVNPLTNDLVDVVGALAEAGLSAEEALTIFGDRGGPAILALTSQAPELRRLTDVINDAKGAAEEMAGVMADNIPGAMRNLASAMEETIHQAGDAGLAGAFRELIESATNVVRIWNGMGDTIEENIEYYERMAGAVEALAYAIGTTLAARAIPAATAALYSMAAAMAVTPIGAFSLALGALVGAYTLLRGEVRSTQTVEEEHQSALDRLKRIRGELTTATDEQAQALRDERQAIIDNTRAELESLRVLLAKERATQAMRAVQPDFDESARIAETESWIAQTEQRLNELEAVANRVAGGLRDTLGAAIASFIADAAGSVEQVTALLKELPSSGSGGGGGGGSGRDIAAEFRAQRDSLLETNDALQGVIAAYGESEQAVAKAQKALELLSATQGISKDFSEEQREALVALMREQQEYTDSIEGLRRIQDLDGQLELLQAELSLVGETKAVREEALAVLEAEIRLKERGVDLSSKQAQEELGRVRQIARTRREIDQSTQAIKDQEQAFQSLVDDTVRYGSDLFADLFRDTSGGWQAMWENMRQTMISTLARMAAEAALRPIVVSVLGAVAGGGAAAAGASGQGGGLLSLFSGGNQQGIGSLFNSGGGSLMPGLDAWAQSNLGFGAMTGGATAGANAAASAGAGAMGQSAAARMGEMGFGAGASAANPGLLNGGSAMAGFSSLGNVLGIVGSALPGLMSGNYVQAAAGTVGAAIGTALLPGVGTAIGGMLGNFAGSFFGSDNTDQEIQPKSAGLGSGHFPKGMKTPFRRLQPGSARFDVSGLTRQMAEMDNALAEIMGERLTDQIRAMYDAAGRIVGERRDNKELGPKHLARFLRDSYRPIIEGLGGAAAGQGFKGMTGDDPDQVMETVQRVVGFLSGLKEDRLFKPQEISQLEQAWKALNAQIDDAKNMAEQLGQSLSEVERQGREAQQAFHDEIQQGYQDQIDAFLRPTELAWRQLRQAQEKELKSLEAVGASTAKAQQWHQLQIRQLFEQNYELQRQYLEGMIDLGEDLNAQVGALWGIVSSGIGQLAQDTSSAYQEAVRLGRQYSQINRSLQQTILGLQIGPQSPLSLEQQLAEAIDQFRNALGSALTGDTDAAAQLQQLVNPVLELASQFFGSTEGYAQIFDEMIRGLEMAGVAAETQAGGFAALAGALDAQLQILGEINDVLNQRDELGEDFESRYNKLTSELEDVGYTIGGINAFLQDAASAIPSLIVTAFSSGLDSAQLAKRMGELFQVTITTTEHVMTTGIDDLGKAIKGAQQKLLRGWIPDFIDLADAFTGTIPDIHFDEVTARVTAHYETSATRLGAGLESAVAAVQFDGLEQSVYTMQELVGDRFDAAVGGISFDGIDGKLLSATIQDGITGVVEAAQASLNGQAQRITGVIDRTLESFTLDATRATILDSVDLINRGATSVRLAFGRVEGALLRLSNNADGHITALIDEVDTAIGRFVNWGQGSLRVGVESLRAGLLDVRNAGLGALELWADTVEARETRISNLGPGALAARINSLRGQLVNVRNSGAGLLEFWADTVESRAAVIENIDRGNLRAAINDLRGGIVMVRNLSRGHLQFWANRVKADTVRIENIDRGDLQAIVNDLRAGILTIRNRAAGHLEFWSDRVEAGETRIENIDRGDLNATIGTLRSALVTIRNLGAGRLEFWAETIKAQETRIENLGSGSLVAFVNALRSSLVVIRNAGQGRLEFWADTVEAQETRIENLGNGNLVAFVNKLRSSLVVIRNAGQGRLVFWADTVEAQEARIENLNAGTLVAQINSLRSDLLTIRNAGQGRLHFWAETVKAREKSVTGIDAGNIGKNAASYRSRLIAIRNAGQARLNFWQGEVNKRINPIKQIGIGNIGKNANTLRHRLATTRNTAQQRLGAWATRVKQELNRITNLSKDLGGGSIAAELKKIVKNNLPKRFNSAINQAFQNVFGTQRGNFFGNMKNLLGDNSALVSNLRSLTLALRKQEKQALNKAISDYASRAGREAGDSLKSANVSVPTQQSSGRSQKDWERLGDVARATMSLKSGSFSNWDIPGSDRNKDWLMSYRPMLTGLAQQMQDLVGGTLPRVNLAVNTSKGVPQLRMQVGGHNWMTFSGATLELDNVAAKFAQSLKWMLSKTISGEKDKILRSVDFSKDAVGGMRELARKLAQAGIAPGFADGGTHQGGLRIVGERGPELEYTGPSRIYSAPDTSRILSAFANDNGSFRELIAEVRALRAENAELRRTVSEGFGDTVQAEGQSGLALRGELRALREDVEELQASTRQQARRRAA